MAYFRFKIPKYFVGVRFDIRLKKREGTKVYGVTNKIGSRFVIFLDYDYDNELIIINEVKDLQERYGLGSAYFFKTRAGIHVIIPTIVNYHKLIKIMSDSTCDYQYKTISMNNNTRAWILRTTPKKNNDIIYAGFIDSDSRSLQSHPHLVYLEGRGVPNRDLPYEKSTCDGYELVFGEYEA